MKGRGRTLQVQSTKTPYWTEIKDNKHVKWIRKGHRAKIKWWDGYRKGIVTCVPPDSKNIIIELDNNQGEVAVEIKNSQYKHCLEIWNDPIVEEELKKLKEKDPKEKLKKHYEFLQPGIEESLIVTKEEDNFDPNDW